MIEVVYDKNTVKAENASCVAGRIPKNIRQIGNVPVGKKIYIEDYVMTFLKKIAAPGNTSARGAILLGEYIKGSEGEVLFISGAVEAQNLEFDVEQIRFDDEIWSRLYADINLYFDRLQVVGWFLSRMGFSVEINDKIFRLHMKYFGENEKILFMMDSLEDEDAFYAWEKGSLVRQRGYYVYYVRNEQMQNYIISRKNNITEDKSLDTLKKDEAVLKSFKDMNNGSEKEKSSGGGTGKNYFLYAVSSFVIIFALSAGIVTNSSYDKMKELENSVKKIEGETTSAELPVFADDDENQQSNPEGTTVVDSDADLNLDNEDTEASSESGSTEDSMEIINQNKPTYYEIQEGDTLMSISIKMYNSPDYVDAIMEANGLSEGDTIYTSQKLIIPYIN